MTDSPNMNAEMRDYNMLRSGSPDEVSSLSMFTADSDKLQQQRFEAEFSSLINILEPRNVINLKQFNQRHAEPLRQFLDAANIPLPENFELEVDSLRESFTTPDGTPCLQKLIHLKESLRQKIRDDSGPPIRAEAYSAQSASGIPNNDILVRLLDQMERLEHRMFKHSRRKSVLEESAIASLRRKPERDANEQKEDVEHAETAVPQTISEYISRFRRMVEYYLIESQETLGMSLNLFIFFLIFWSCVMFVVEIQTGSNDYWMEAMFTTIFTIEYAFRAFGEKNPLNYILSFYGIIDLASIFPFYLDIMLQGNSDANLGFLRACRTMRALKLLNFIDSDKDKKKIEVSLPIIPFLTSRKICLFKMSTIYIEIIRSVFTVIVIIFVIAGTYVSIDPDAVEDNFWMSLYFVIITITTVGYGDYSPTTDSGRITICFAIIAALIVVPTQYNRIGEAMNDVQKESEEKHRKHLNQMKMEHSMHSLPVDHDDLEMMERIGNPSEMKVAE